MIDVQLLLASPQAAVLRARWNTFCNIRWHYGTEGLTFDHVVETYCTEFPTHADFGRRHRITRQAASQMFDTYVRPLLEGDNGSSSVEDVREHYAWKRAIRSDAERELALLEQHEFLRMTIMTARAMGYVTELVPQRRPPGFCTTWIDINQRRCKLHCTTRIHWTKSQRREYYHLTSTPMGLFAADCLIIWCIAHARHPRTYVVPTTALVDAYPNAIHRQTPLYPPADDKPPRRKGKSALDWEAHEEGWHHLAPKAHEPDSS